MSTEIKKGQYNFQAIETKWRSHWEREKTYQTLGPGNPSFDDSRPPRVVEDGALATRRTSPAPDALSVMRFP